MKLRQYQQDAIDSIKSKKPLIYLSTGAGKSIIFKEIARRAIEKKNKVCFVVYGKSIVDQAARKHFSTVTNKIGVIMGPKKYKPHRDIYCCSISTLTRSHDLALKLINECSLFIIDEAHNAVSTGYHNFLSAIPENKYVIGLTATPFRIGKKGHTYWDDVIHPISTHGLIKQGHLVMPRVFGPPAMSTENVRTTAGDYNNRQLFQKNNDMIIYGDILKSWKKFAINKKTLCFAINKEHAVNLKNVFNDNNIPAAYADADTQQDDRLRLFNQLASGEIKVLTNCNIASTGVDIPEVECVLSARPTKSRVLWIQQVGRALRPAPKKTEAIIIDHGGNCDRLGHPLIDFDADLTDKTSGQSNDQKIPSLKTCPECFYKTSPAAAKCIQCGHVFKATQRDKKEDKTVELQEKKIEPITWANKHLNPSAPIEIKRYSEKIAKRIRANNYKKNSYFFKMYEKYGQTQHIRYPAWFLKIKNNTTPSTKDSLEVSQLIYKNSILWDGSSSDM